MKLFSHRWVLTRDNTEVHLNVRFGRIKSIRYRTPEGRWLNVPKRYWNAALFTKPDYLVTGVLASRW